MYVCICVFIVQYLSTDLSVYITLSVCPNSLFVYVREAIDGCVFIVVQH